MNEQLQIDIKQAIATGNKDAICALASRCYFEMGIDPKAVQFQFCIWGADEALMASFFDGSYAREKKAARSQKQ